MGFRENATNLLTLSVSVPHEIVLSISKPLSQHSIVSLHRQKRERKWERKGRERRRVGEWERGRERMDREVSESNVLLTLAIWEQHFSIEKIGPCSQASHLLHSAQ